MQGKGVTLGSLCCVQPCGILFESEGCPSSELSLAAVLEQSPRVPVSVVLMIAKILLSS